MTCGIYMIKNKVNGKMYIGQAVDIERRWGRHRSGLRGNDHDNKHLQNAWNKDGESNFEFTIICECEESQLNTLEIDYIAKLKTHDPDFGYNKTYGGEGCRPTEEIRKKLSEAHKGKSLSEEHKKKLSESLKGENNPWYGKHPSEEVRKKISEAHKGKSFSEEHKKKLSEANKGHIVSEETRRKLSIPIVQIDPSTDKVVNIWGSGMAAERECRYSTSHIANCCKGKRKSHGGYKWMYLKDWLKEHNKGISKKLYFID